VTVLVDSDILIEVSRARDPRIASQWTRLRHVRTGKALSRVTDPEIASRWTSLGDSEARILYSPVSVADVWTGARPSEYAAIDDLFRTLICAPIDAETGRKAGDYLRLYKKNHGVELGDALIAAGAYLNKATLWTRNRKHYPMKELSFY
jgi:predicted nucleic acid-binding protein